MAGILIDILWAIFYTVVLAIIVYAIIYGWASITNTTVPDPIQKLLWVMVGLFFVIMMLTILLGAGPGAPFRWRSSIPGGALAALSAGTAFDL